MCAVFNNCKLGIGLRFWVCVSLVLVCSVRSSGERLRHRNGNHVAEDIYVEQLEKSAVAEESARSSACPNCQYKPERELKPEPDTLRLEAIKRQILSKLGMRHKPNITHSLPREIIMQTLDRADNSDFSRVSSDISNNKFNFNSNNNHYNNNNNNNNYTASSSTTLSAASTTHRSGSSSGGGGGGGESMDFDDFYGRTSEIISFAEQGFRLNHNRLLEFRVSPESGQAGQEFRVRTATLWLKADNKRHRSPPDCRSEIYVFKIISRLTESITLSSQDFDRVTSYPITLTLHESKSGWHQLDLTDTVQTWLTESSQDKLQLMVDCSCCSHWHIHLFNTAEADKSAANANRPFLQIRTDPNTAKRVRRRALDCSADSGNQCCKQRFYVSFKQLGWDDWVIAPQGYYANYCRGDCGHHRTPDSYNTYHQHVIEEVRKTHHLSGMQPCCAPLKFSSMSLIYYGPDLTIIKRDLPKMVVDECGCP